MNMHEHILAALREQFNQWEELLASLSEAQIHAPHLPSHWSTKDEIAHLRAWQQRTIARLDAVRLDREPEYPQWLPGVNPNTPEGVDQINDWLYETYRAQPWEKVHQDWRDGYLRFIEAGRQIEEKDLLDSSRFAWLSSHPIVLSLLYSYDHHQEHLDKLKAWLHAAESCATQPRDIILR